MTTIIILMFIAQITALICFAVLTHEHRTPLNILITILLVCSTSVTLIQLSHQFHKSSPTFLLNSPNSKEDLIKEINDSIISQSKYQNINYHLNNLENIRNQVVKTNNPDSILTYQNIFKVLSHDNYITLKTINK